jgi:hypothetical protein
MGDHQEAEVPRGDHPSEDNTEAKPSNLRPPTCIICSNLTPHKCGRCQQASYCTVECQQTDWNVHKMLCSSFQDFETPPDENRYRAILFDYKKKKPEFVWIEKDVSANRMVYPKKHLEELVGAGSSNTFSDKGFPMGIPEDIAGQLTTLIYTANPVRNRLIEDGELTINCKWQEFGPYRYNIDDESDINQGVQAIIGKGANWQGDNIIPYGQVTSEI